MNGIIVLFAWPLVIGIIVLMMGLHRTSLTEKILLSSTQLTFLQIVGAILTTIGGIGFLYGLYDEISVHEKKEREAEERRLRNEQITNERALP